MVAVKKQMNDMITWTPQEAGVEAAIEIESEVERGSHSRRPSAASSRLNSFDNPEPVESHLVEGSEVYL